MRNRHTSPRLLLLSPIFRSRIHRMDPQDHTAPDHVQVLLIGPGKATVLRRLIERTSMLPRCSPLALNTEPRWRCREHVALAVTAQTIRSAY